MTRSLVTAFVSLIALHISACDSSPSAANDVEGAHAGGAGAGGSPRTSTLGGAGGAASPNAGRAAGGGGRSGRAAGSGGMPKASDPAAGSGGRSGGAAGSGGMSGASGPVVGSGGMSGPSVPAAGSGGTSSPPAGCGPLCDAGSCVDPATCNVAPCTGVIGLPARPTLAVRTSPRAVLAVDLNGDGRADLATVNTVDKSISVLLNTDRGTFATAQQYSLGDEVLNPDTLIAADLNDDTKPELISPDGLVFTNQGDGTFSAAVHAFDHAAVALVAADLDADGRIDLALAGYTPDHVTVLLNQGSNSYTSRDFPAGEAALRIVSADLNRDDRPDIVTLSADAKRVQVLLNEGAGKLSQPHIYQTGLVYTATTSGVSWQLVAADFDGDGATDVIAADGLQSQLSLLKNRGTGTFAGPSISDLGALTPEALTVADVNADGKPDLVMVDSGRDDIGIVYNQGAGNFAPAQLIPAGFQPWALAVADLNGDQRPDLAVANEKTDDVDVLWSRGDGSFVAPIALRFALGAWPTYLSTADLDGDQRPDVAVANRNAISVFYSSLGLSRAADLSLTGGDIAAFAVADVDGDARVDVTVTDTIALQVFRRMDAGQFRLAGRYMADSPRHRPYKLVAADVNRDGRFDMVSSDREGNNLAVWLNTGKQGEYDPLFAKPILYPAGMLPDALVAADFNHDNAIDLAVVNARPQFSPEDMLCTISVLLNQGDGTYAAPQTLTAGHYPTALISADIDADTNPDLLVADSQDADVKVYRGQPNGTFAAPVSYQVPHAPSQLMAADLNADKHLDLAVSGATGSVRILLNTGSGQFGAPARYTAGRGAAAFGSADFNRDGRMDLVVSNPGQERVLLMLNQCSSE